MKFNEKITQCRKKLGLSQEELALKIGVSRQSISKWETGEASPEISKLPLLAEIFGVSTDWLLSEDDVDDNQDFKEETQTTSKIEFPSWIDKLPHHMLTMVKRFGWLYGVYLTFGGALFTAMGLFSRKIFKMMILGNPTQFFQGNSEIPFQQLESIIMNPSYGFYSSFELQSWNIAKTFTGFIIGLGIVIMIVGLVLAIILRYWGKKADN